MKKLILIAITVGLLGTSAKVMATGMPVYDGSRAFDFTQEMIRMQDQLDTARDQLKEAQRMYTSVTGTRGLGGTLRNPNLREFLPEELKSVYDSASGGGYAGISGSIQDIMKEEQLSGSMASQQEAIQQRMRQAAATDKALGLRAYEGAQKRLDTIELLMNEINKTQDQKAISELQARIAGEQAAIQNETTKLQMIAHLRQAEQALIEEQKDALAMQVLSNKNQTMPRIR